MISAWARMLRREGSSAPLSSRQLGALALTAAGFPIFRYCCRVSWPWALLGGLAAAAALSGLTLLRNRRGGEGPGSRRGGRIFPVVCKALLMLLLLTGALYTAWESSFAFPETGGNLPAAGLVLLLAAAASRRGPAAAGRTAGILLWVTGILYGTVLVFSLPELRAEWLRPSGEPLEALGVWAALTLPGAALCLCVKLPTEQKLPHWPWWSAAGLAAAASVLTGGILSPALAREPEAFRTLARGVSVLGVIRRFEALVNGALLMSGFALCTLYIVSFFGLTGIYSDCKTAQKKFKKTQKKC